MYPEIESLINRLEKSFSDIFFVANVKKTRNVPLFTSVFNKNTMKDLIVSIIYRVLKLAIYEARLTKEDTILKNMYMSYPEKNIVFTMGELIDEIVKCIDKEKDHLLDLCIDLGDDEKMDRDMNVYYYPYLFFYEDTSEDSYELSFTNYCFNRNIVCDMEDSIKILMKKRVLFHLMESEVISIKLKR